MSIYDDKMLQAAERQVADTLSALLAELNRMAQTNSREFVKDDGFDAQGFRVGGTLVIEGPLRDLLVAYNEALRVRTALRISHAKPL